MEKYSVKFLYQFRIESARSCKMRTSEEKIVLFHIDSKKNNNDIFDTMNKRAKEEEFDYLNDEGSIVYYEYIGIMDICHLGLEVEDNVVWYDIKTLLMPMERKDKILPTIAQLKKRLNSGV